MKDVRFIYGAGFIQRYVTELASANFIKDNKLFIDKEVSFNRIFSDVLPGAEKTLLIEFPDKTFISLPEIRANDYTFVLG